MKFRTAPSEKRDQTPQERMSTQIMRNGRYSVSFSIAYVRVSEWISDPQENSRPKPDILDQAEVHALRMEDKFMLEHIERARKEWTAVEGLPTPKRPPPPDPDQKIFDVGDIVEVNSATYKDHSVGRAREEDIRKQILSAPKIGDDIDLLRRYIRDLK